MGGFRHNEELNMTSNSNSKTNQNKTEQKYQGELENLSDLSDDEYNFER